jgi:hypothetical protein
MAASLEDELQEQLLLKEQLANKLENMRIHLEKIKNQVDETDSSRIKEVRLAEQRKRQEVIKRRGIEVPTYQTAGVRTKRGSMAAGSKKRNNSQHGGSSISVTRQKETASRLA